MQGQRGPFGLGVRFGSYILYTVEQKIANDLSELLQRHAVFYISILATITITTIFPPKDKHPLQQPLTACLNLL